MKHRNIRIITLKLHSETNDFHILVLLWKEMLSQYTRTLLFNCWAVHRNAVLTYMCICMYVRVFAWFCKMVALSLLCTRLRYFQFDSSKWLKIFFVKIFKKKTNNFSFCQRVKFLKSKEFNSCHFNRHIWIRNWPFLAFLKWRFPAEANFSSILILSVTSSFISFRAIYWYWINSRWKFN